jgi:glycosyltransferase involved in cell wall biosynthesis
VSISDAQRSALPEAAWMGTVHHGLPLELLRPVQGPRHYLAFLGRISPEKGVDRAIEIARRCQIELRIAAKVDSVDRDYFRHEIEPQLGGPYVRYVGEIGDSEKAAFLGGAHALLFPIDWPEPFGLVMIEAMACGTPVIAFPGGSVAEILEPGVTGFLVDDVEAATAAVGAARRLDRSRCRARFEQRFSASRMARDYVGLYERVIAARSRQPGRIISRPALARLRPGDLPSQQPLPAAESVPDRRAHRRLRGSGW